MTQSANDERYLLPREVNIATVRQHPAVLIVPAAQAVCGLVVGLMLTWALPVSQPQRIAVWALVSLLVVYCLWAAARWLTGYLVVTSERLLTVSGVTYRRVAMVPLTELKEMTLVRTWSGRLLGYGAFVNGSGLSAWVINAVPYPEQLYLLITGMLFPSSADDQADEDASVAEDA